MSSNADTNMDTLANPETLPSEEQRLRRLYGNKKPLGHVDLFRQAKDGRQAKGGRKQYFDSGEYAMAQAGKGDAIDVGAIGRQHPSPESIPHPVTPTNSTNGPGPNSKIPGAVLITGPHISQGAQSAGSPVKETSHLSRETSADDMDDDSEEASQRHQGVQQQHGDNAAQHGADGLPIRT